MKLNKTYGQQEMLRAMDAASRTWREVSAEMRRTGAYHLEYTVFEHEGMLTNSTFARVTLTICVNENRWEGYMETSAFADGPRVKVAVIRHNRALFANDDFTKFTEFECNEIGYPIEELCTYTFAKRN